MIEILKEKKVLVLTIALVILIALLLPLVRCTSPQSEEQADPSQEQIIDGNSKNASSEDEADAEKTQVQISERQQELINSYDNNEWNLVGLLKANVWTANKDTTTIKFSDNTYVESSNNTSVEKAYAICGIEESESTESGVNGESETTEDTTATLMYEDGTYGILHVKNITSTSNPTPEITLNSSNFEKSKSYIRTKAAAGLSVEGLNEDAKNVIDNKEDELQSFLTDYCSVFYPTASVAQWDETFTANYNNNIVELSFTLNNLDTSRIAVTYDVSYNEFGIGGM